MATMRAVVLDGPGPPSALHVREVPIPVPAPGWVLIVVKAFGLNRSELHSRLGRAEGMTWPRVLGIEATGVVESCPGGEFRPGQQVAALMGGMGRAYDGGYAEYTCVPASQVVPFESGLDWATLGAIPEMLQTANGSLTVGLDAQGGQSLLVRGGTSSVGMATYWIDGSWVDSGEYHDSINPATGEVVGSYSMGTPKDGVLLYR
jgi:NADPH:quinone reductase